MSNTNDSASRIDYGKLCSEIIGIWRLESKENTLVLLAERTNIAYSWIRLLNQGSTNSTLDTFYRLLTAMWSPTRVKNILLERTPRGAEVIAELEKLGVVFTSLELSDLREAAFVARIVGRERMTKADAIAMLGAECCDVILSKFIAYDLIAVDDDNAGLITLNNNLLEVTSSQALKMFSRLIVEAHNLLAGNRGDVRIQGLNDEGIEEINKLISAFQVSLIKILTDKRFHGEKVFGVTLNTAFL